MTGPPSEERLHLLLQRKQWERAETMACELIAARPATSYALRALSIAQENQGKLAEARRNAEEACRLVPDEFWNPIRLSYVAMRQRDLTLAVDSASRAVTLGPSEPASHRALALACLRRVEASDPRSVFDPFTALLAMDTVLRLRPPTWGAHLVRGNALAALARRGDAIRAFRSALALEPNQHDAYNNWGLQEKRRRPIRATRLFAQAAALDPSCPNPRRNLSEALQAWLYRLVSVFVLSGLGVALVHRWVPASTRVVVLISVSVLCAAGSVVLWRAVPRKARWSLVRGQPRAGVALAGAVPVVMALDAAIAVGTRDVASACVLPLALVASSMLILPRVGLLVPRIHRDLPWLVPQVVSRRRRHGPDPRSSYPSMGQTH